MGALLSLFNITRKRRIKNFIYFIFAGIFAVVNLTGCESNHVVPIEDANIDLTPTDQLVIELPEWAYLSRIYFYALQAFQTQYPDVQVTVTYIGEKSDEPMNQYQTTIGTEIMAGVGPDVILTDYFPDLYKTMDSGAFVNLNSIISSDSDFHMDDYNTVVMNAGYYKGGQYIMPIGYTLPTLLLSERGLLEKVGFNISNPLDVVSFLNETEAFLLAHDDIRIEWYTKLGGHLLAMSGISLVDLETKNVLPNETAFRTFCEAYQPFYDMDISINKFSSYMTLGEIIMDGKLLFMSGSASVSDHPLAGYTYFTAEGGSHVDVPVHSIDGGLVASATHGLAINANSNNQLNAWNFIKIALSQEIQTLAVAIDSNYNMFVAYPVNNATLAEFMKINPTNGNVSIPDDYRASYIAMLNSITDCVLPETALTDMFYAKMEPYFTGKQSLDSCISAFKTSLTTYSTE